MCETSGPTDAADLREKLTAYVQMRVDEQNALKAKENAAADAHKLVGKRVKIGA